MQSRSLRFALGLVFSALPLLGAVAGDEGFKVIFDKSHTDGWRYVGDGEMEIRDGVATTPTSRGARQGVYWYSKASFADFTLKAEFKTDTATSNSGLLVRFPDPAGDYDTAVARGYEIDIFGDKTGTIVTPKEKIRPSKIVPLHPREWNECTVTVTGQKYTVTLNGQVVNEFTGNGSTSGHVGLLNWKGDGDVHFRNVRIKELPSAGASDASLTSNGPGKPDQSFIEVLSAQAPNALEWALAPLDRTTPPDIRQNLTVLREDLLDEAAKRPAAGPDAYKLARQLCNELIETLNERDRALVRAGFTAVQADANMSRMGQSPQVTRNYKMKWPQYASDKDQQKEARTRKEGDAALAKQRPVLEWTERATSVRPRVDQLYAQFRAAARVPLPARTP